MPLITCEISLILTWSAYCVLSNAVVNQAATFAITDTKIYVPIVALSTQDIAKLVQQLKSGFKITTNWNKSQSKVTIKIQNRYLDYLIDLSFQRVNRFFVLSFSNGTGRTRNTRYFL